MQREITMSYILGLMEADGGILLMFGTGKSKRTLKPWVRISQKSNENTLPMIESFFVKNGIECRYEDWNPLTSKGRARNLTITKVNSVRKFIELVKQEPIQFISQKQRDFLILDHVLNTPNVLDIKDKVNLKLSMHKVDKNQPDVQNVGKKTREQLEEQFAIPLGQSNEDASGILKQIDQQFADHTAKIEDLMDKKELTIPPDWLAGLIDGDGSYYLSLQERAPSEKYSKPFLEVQANFTITMETNSLLTLKVIKYLVDSKAPILKSKNHYQLWIRTQAEVKNLLKLQQAYLPIGNHRLRQYRLIANVHSYKETGMMRDVDTVLSVVREAYAISEKSKGPARSKSLEEIEAFIRQNYN